MKQPRACATAQGSGGFEQQSSASIRIRVAGAASPVYALVRAGYFNADEKHFGSADGGYAGVGLGVDFGRRFNMSLVYTNYVYFNELYWSEGDLYYDASRADALMLGAEVRF